MALFVGAMDIHHPNPESETQYYVSKNRYPTSSSCDEFELFICPYDPYHKINSKRWRGHLINCGKNHKVPRKNCPFNFSHTVPEPEWDYHLVTCPDKAFVSKAMAGSGIRLATQVDHTADPVGETSEDWEAEENTGVKFELDVRMGMPLTRRPAASSSNQEDDPYKFEEAESDDDDNEEVSGECVDQDSRAALLSEELVPEKPSGWQSMNKTQKKNHRRKFDRQQQRMKALGVTEDDFKQSCNPRLWSPQEQKAKIDAIVAAFPTVNEKFHSERADYTSLLNCVCQKLRWNPPKYNECAAGPKGGFAYECVVQLQKIRGYDFCSTKKDAKHECAKWALLLLDIPLDGSVDRGGRPLQQALPGMQDQLREGDEMGRLMAAGQNPFQVKPYQPLRKPNLPGDISSRPTHLQQEQERTAQLESRSLPRSEPVAAPVLLPVTGQAESVAAAQHRPSAAPPPGFESKGEFSFQSRAIRPPPGLQRPALPNPTIQPTCPPAAGKPFQGWTRLPQSVSQGSIPKPSTVADYPPSSFDQRMEALAVGGEEFPSLGRAPQDDWQTVHAKSSRGSPARKPGRGRGTTLSS